MNGDSHPAGGDEDYSRDELLEVMTEALCHLLAYGRKAEALDMADGLLILTEDDDGPVNVLLRAAYDMIGGLNDDGSVAGDVQEGDWWPS